MFKQLHVSTVWQDNSVVRISILNGRVMVSPYIYYDDISFCWYDKDLASRLLG
jgi:hypothetical protein